MFTNNFLPWSAETTNVQIGCDNSHINCFKTIKSCFLLSLIIQFWPNDISLFSPPEYVSQSHPHVYPIQNRPPSKPSRPHPPLLLTPEAFMKCENLKFLLRGCYNLNTVNITRPCCILRVSSCRLFYACQAIQSTNSTNQTRHSWCEQRKWERERKWRAPTSCFLLNYSHWQLLMMFCTVLALRVRERENVTLLSSGISIRGNMNLREDSPSSSSSSGVNVWQSSAHRQSMSGSYCKHN